ncbi:MAG: ATP-binding protein [Flavobacteriaceae bacterium]|jgi:predicted AAA+ superfamily ATPase|nr:ATP-binding protein [Flavobacteriaceae bacterium]
MINRIIVKNIKKRLNKGKAIILLGARQTGKTTLLHHIFPRRKDVLWLNGDETDIQNIFKNASATRLKALIGNNKTIIIDEAQRIKNIGLRLKLITDEIKNIQLIATGSSAFELNNLVNEPLTGRKWEFSLFPISFQEMVDHHGILEEKRMLPHRLLYGYYPDVVINHGSEKDILKQLSDSYLYKDILQWERIQKPDSLLKLLQALAFQIGNQVSYNELSNICGLDPKTIEKYILLLEKTFIIFRLGSFRRNLRNELKQSKKIYFYDNGIRNALIANFNQIEMRNDKGALWENFIISERMKKLHYDELWVNSWFWRTKDQNEIDYIEETDGKITAYEIKWSPHAKVKINPSFKQAYHAEHLKVITPDNFEDFLL